VAFSELASSLINALQKDESDAKDDKSQKRIGGDLA